MSTVARPVHRRRVVAKVEARRSTPLRQPRLSVSAELRSTAYEADKGSQRMSEDEVAAFLTAADARRVFLFRFTDGTEVELSDPLVRAIDGGKRECIATVVRETPGVDAAAGSSLWFALGEVAEVRLSSRPFDYFR
jgi:hypothetical protein